MAHVSTSISEGNILTHCDRQLRLWFVCRNWSTDQLSTMYQGTWIAKSAMQNWNKEIRWHIMKWPLVNWLIGWWKSRMRGMSINYQFVIFGRLNARAHSARLWSTCSSLYWSSAAYLITSGGCVFAMLNWNSLPCALPEATRSPAVWNMSTWAKTQNTIAFEPFKSVSISHSFSFAKTYLSNKNQIITIIIWLASLLYAFSSWFMSVVKLLSSRQPFIAWGLDPVISS
jgi:hypothetical protein